jgi:hypothetical protein
MPETISPYPNDLANLSTKLKPPASIKTIPVTKTNNELIHKNLIFN